MLNDQGIYEVNEKVYKATKKFLSGPDRILAHEGSARSGKTYSICENIQIEYCPQHTGEVITIARKTFSALKDSVMRDFFEILKELQLYDRNYHNKTDHEYVLNGNLIEFRGLDHPQKKRGSKRSILWLNEANEFTLEDWRQMNMRTSGKVIVDYNPSDEYHWLYEKVLNRKDCKKIHSTFLENKFLEQTIKDEILRYKKEDPNYWNIFGLGKRGKSLEKIYSKWEMCYGVYPENYDDICFGVDFGFNHQSAIAEYRLKDGVVHVRQLVYASGLSNPELIEEAKKVIPRELRSHFFYADHEKDRIKEFVNAGFNMQEADKQSVHAGIVFCQRFTEKIYNSPDYEKEIKKYSWRKNRDGMILDEPIKINDHLMDTKRYALWTHLGVRVDHDDCRHKLIETSGRVFDE